MTEHDVLLIYYESGDLAHYEYEYFHTAIEARQFAYDNNIKSYKIFKLFEDKQ